MAAKDEGDKEEGSGAGARSGSSGARKAASAVSTASYAPSNTATGTGDPDPSDHTPHIGGQEVTFAASADEADTFRKPVVLQGPPNPADPGQELVLVKKDVIEEFQHAGESRKTSARIVMAAGTLTTRRVAEEAGVKDYEEYQP